MNLIDVAHQAAINASDSVSVALTEADIGQITVIIANAMEIAVQEASSQHSTVCVSCLNHDQDLAHKIQREMERKKVGLIANLSSLR